MAILHRASAGTACPNAIHLSAPKGSPAWSARRRRDERIHVAPYVVIECHQKTPSHLLLPVRRRQS
jgi:hypothetical protein